MGDNDRVRVNLYTGDNLEFAPQTPVLHVLRRCAEYLRISSYYFGRFLLRSKEGLVLPYRCNLPATNEEFYFAIIGSLPLDEIMHGDVECFRYVFLQCRTLFLEGHTGRESEDNADRLHAVLLAWFARSFGLPLRRADIKKTLRKYNRVYKQDVNEKNLINALETIDFERNTATNHVKYFIQQYTMLRDENEMELRKFDVSPSDEKSPRTVSVTSSKLHLSSSKKNTEVKLSDIKCVSSNSSLLVVLTLYSEVSYHLKLSDVKNYETFLALIDHNIRQLRDGFCVIHSVVDIPVEMAKYDPIEKYNILRQPILPFHNVSSKELKLAIEIYGKCNGWYGVIEIAPSKNIKSKDIFWVLVYCVENTVAEKIICRSGESFYLEEAQHFQYSSLSALIHLTKFRLSIAGKAYSLTNQITETLLKDIQDPEVSKIFIPHASLHIEPDHSAENWLAVVYKGKLSKSAGPRTVTYFDYREWSITEDDRKSFISNASILVKIQNENILHILGICSLFHSKKLRFITEDVPFYTLHQHLQTDYIPRQAHSMDYSVRLSENSDEGQRYTLLFKYVRSIVAGLQFLHSNKIYHTFPAPQHILIDCNQHHLKLFDIGLFGKVYQGNSSFRDIIAESEKDGTSILRWMSHEAMSVPSLVNTTYHDKWVFAATVSQIFNEGTMPLAQYSNEELMQGYMDLKDQKSKQHENNTSSSSPWTNIEFIIPQQSYKLNKMLQKLLNFIVDRCYDGTDFQEVADLYNTFIFPVDREVDVYERIDSNTDIKIRRGPEGKLFFDKQTIKSNSPKFPRHIPSTFEKDDAFEGEYSDYSDYEDDHDCDNSEPEQQLSNGYDYDCDNDDDGNGTITQNYTKFDLCYDDANDTEPGFFHSSLLNAELLKFNNKRWESSYYSLNEKIGAGNFGVVRKATVAHSSFLPPSLQGKEVAVKLFYLQGENQTESGMEGILKEAVTMSKLEHHRIVPFFGISATDDYKEIHIIMPLYPYGCLKKYIANYHNELKRERLISFGLQIAEGMDYISSQGFVHRDLALRNILVEDHSRVRIADLGLTRNVDKDYYYILNHSSNKLPVLSYPPEFFSNNFKYDKKCDVWSYGVTCFEMWSYGETPYAAQKVTDSHQLVEFLKTNTLGIPDATPDIFEHVMKKCWLPKKDRWDFKDILNYIKTNVVYVNPSSRRRVLPKAAHCKEGELAIHTSVLMSDGYFAVQHIPLKDVNLLKEFTSLPLRDKAGVIQDIQLNDTDIPYEVTTVRVYKMGKLPSDKTLNNVLSLKHRHLMQILGFMRAPGAIYTVAPTHSLGSLYDFCSSTRSENLHCKFSFVVQILRAMLFLKENGVVHGSLSVDNVWLTTKDTVVVTGAGLLRQASLNQSTQQMLVTYPPEVLVGCLDGRDVELNELTDTWMFGILLLQMFSMVPLYADLVPEKTPTDTREFKVMFARNIVGFLQTYSPGLMTKSHWPSEIKNGLNLCFAAESHRVNLTSLKSCFQL